MRTGRGTSPDTPQGRRRSASMSGLWMCRRRLRLYVCSAAQPQQAATRSIRHCSTYLPAPKRVCAGFEELASGVACRTRPRRKATSNRASAIEGLWKTSSQRLASTAPSKPTWATTSDLGQTLDRLRTPEFVTEGCSSRMHQAVAEQHQKAGGVCHPHATSCDPKRALPHGGTRRDNASTPSGATPRHDSERVDCKA